MKISTLLAAGALALACMLFAAPSAFAGPDIMFAAPAVTIDQGIIAPDVCILDVANVCDEAIIASPDPALGTKLQFTASLYDPVSIYELPLYVHFDPGRVADAVV